MIQEMMENGGRKIRKAKRARRKKTGTSQLETKGTMIKYLLTRSQNLDTGLGKRKKVNAMDIVTDEKEEVVGS